jgi:hypothetical protein
MEIITESLITAREGLKRLEHMIYVTLKYTRTVDVIVNTLKRLTDIYELIFDALFRDLMISGAMGVEPKSPALKAKKVAEHYHDDPEMVKFFNFYKFLKTTINAEHHKREEFRRHVTLVVELEDSTVEVNIDNLEDCERFAKRFLSHAVKLVTKDDGKII